MAVKFITLVAGDMSGDGHGMTYTETYTFNNKYMEKDVEKSFKKGLHIIGIPDFREKLENYQSNHLTDGTVQKINNAVHTNIDNIIRPKEYIDIYVKIANLANADLNLTKIDSMEWDIGGYGLFDD